MKSYERAWVGEYKWERIARSDMIIALRQQYPTTVMSVVESIDGGLIAETKYAWYRRK